MTNTFDVSKIREDFPILKEMVNETPLIYLDNAATTQKPLSVIEAMREYYCHYNANVHRGIHTLSEKATLAYEAARSKLQHFINAKERREIIFVRGATEAINLVAQSYVKPRIAAGEAILLTEIEHHSNIVPWQFVCHDTAANIRVVPMTESGELDLEAFEKLLTPETQFLAINHISNALGTINPIKKMIQMAHDHDILVLVDGAQAGPHAAVDVQDLDCDFYVMSGHKMFGPTGIGILYGRAELLEMAAPYQGGGEMITSVSFELSQYAPIPHKFEAGTPNIAGAIGLGAAVDYLLEVGLANIHDYETGLTQYAKDALKQVKAIQLYGTASHKVPIFSFLLPGVHAHDIGTVLNNVGIAIRAGHHCAMPAINRLGVAATARASFAFYNTREEVDALVEALNTVKGVFVGC